MLEELDIEGFEPPSYIYGHNPWGLLRSQDEVMGRLNAILADKVLRFNPYTVDDETLLACAERATWQPLPALTQMVVFHFQDIKRVEWRCPYDAIFFRIGSNPAQQHLSIFSLIDRLTYTATRQPVHVKANGKVLTNRKMVEKMQGRDYFISHYLHTEMPNGRTLPAYRMHWLKGDTKQKASTIRSSMVEAKIEMLQEVLAHPYSPAYLRCKRDCIDYATPIHKTIDAIRRFPLAAPKKIFI
ncbi:MAG: hypothetical protein NC102_03200 [Clostridium sp.]|nr:hypothetical protein [Clostridium sp.]